jgi:GT2 family glycosyltransferase
VNNPATAPGPHSAAQAEFARSSASQPPALSVVVPTYNRQASLVRLLQALGRQTFPFERFEVVVVDDGSTDRTAEALASFVAPYAFQWQVQENRGPAAARNTGVERARGQLILFLDDDVEPLPDLLTVHATHHQRVPRLVVVGPMLAPPGWRRPAWIRWEEEMLARQYRALAEGRYPCTPRQFYTGNASLPRSLFVEAGGFDTRFGRAEDVDLAWRLAQVGSVFQFEADAQVLHYPERSLESWCRTPYQYGRFDVQMSREKGLPALQLAFREFRQRHLLSRLLARGLADRPGLAGLTVAGLRAGVCLTDRLGLRRAPLAMLSAIFQLRYWRGVSDGLGGLGNLLGAEQAAGLIERQIARDQPVPRLSRRSAPVGLVGAEGWRES